MFGFLNALIPGGASGRQSNLLGFPSTPRYGGRSQSSTRSGFVGGLFGFPGTPAYADPSIPEPEPCPDPPNPDSTHKGRLDS